MQLGIHHVDTLSYWLGPVRAGVAAASRTSTPRRDIDDVGVVTLEFESGALGDRYGELRVAEDALAAAARHRRGARLPHRLLGLARRAGARRGSRRSRSAASRSTSRSATCLPRSSPSSGAASAARRSPRRARTRASPRSPRCSARSRTHRGGSGLMRAAVVEAVGSPPAAADVDEPVRERGSALVAVAAAPLNPVEIRVASGRHPRRAEPPYVPGLEGAGTVIESDRLPAGTRVRFESAALPGFGVRWDARRARRGAGGVAGRAARRRRGRPCRRGRRGGHHRAARPGTRRAGRGRTRDGARRDRRGRADGGAAREAHRVPPAWWAPAEARSGSSACASSAPTRWSSLAGGDLQDAFERAAGGQLAGRHRRALGRARDGRARASLATEGRLVNVGQPAGTDVRIPLETVRNRQGAIHAISSGWTSSAARPRRTGG